jgi:hypothetical protein
MGVHVEILVSWARRRTPTVPRTAGDQRKSASSDTSSADLQRLVNRMFAFAANAADRTDRHRSIA